MASEKGMYRIFKLIRLLNSTPRRTARQLQELLGVSSSQIYRDIKFLEDLGYPVDHDQNERYFLQFPFQKRKQSVLDANDLFFLQDQLQSLATQSPEAQAILQKLNLNLSMIPLADSLPQLHEVRIIQLIRTGIDVKKRIVLRSYRSLSSGKVADREVEPLDLSMDNRYLLGWDISKDRQGQFKLARIQDVDILEESIDESRVASPIDLFGLTGKEWLPVLLALSPIAHNLLLEEFPDARPFIKRKQDGVFFDGQVRDWKGIGRFVLGLPGEITVVRPDSFKTYLQERAAKMTF